MFKEQPLGVGLLMLQRLLQQSCSMDFGPLEFRLRFQGLVGK
ncbi:MAG: hypothetical protein JWP84_1290 [Tardiphaga sp.]|jgi:hypothetical protein|nr:hypothetical protein [Tardiphaga sp.]